MGEWHDDKDFPKRSPMTDLTEQIAEWLSNHDIWREKGMSWEDYKRHYPGRVKDLQSKADEFLRFLSSLGLVQLEEDQRYDLSSNDPLMEKTMRLAGDMMKSGGFRRVHSILPQEKGK